MTGKIDASRAYSLWAVEYHRGFIPAKHRLVDNDASSAGRERNLQGGLHVVRKLGHEPREAEPLLQKSVHALTHLHVLPPDTCVHMRRVCVRAYA
jgi:hypothetical protein